MAPSGRAARLKSLKMLFLISFLIIGIDQLFKFIMLNALAYGVSIPVIKDFFSLTLVFNSGAAFGILQGRKLLFLLLPVVTGIIILTLYYKSKEKKLLCMPFGLLLGGVLGNFVDRIRHGYVIDFYDLFIKDMHWPAFNIADACICFGMFLIIFQTFGKVKRI